MIGTSIQTARVEYKCIFFCILLSRTFIWYCKFSPILSLLNFDFFLQKLTDHGPSYWIFLILINTSNLYLFWLILHTFLKWSLPINGFAYACIYHDCFWTTTCFHIMLFVFITSKQNSRVHFFLGRLRIMNVYKDKKKFSKLSSGLCVGDWISNDVQTEVAILQVDWHLLLGYIKT